MRRNMHAAALVTIAVIAAPPSFAQQLPDPPPPLGTASFTPPPKTDAEPLTPQTFVTRAAVANMTELELSQLALRKTNTPPIQVFASTMMKDHKAVQAKLKQVAATLKIALPGTADEKHRAAKRKLGELYARDFDVEFAKTVSASHEETLRLFETAAQSSALPAELREFASGQLPTLTKHRDAARSLREQIGS
jgi:putative membrane protein